MHIIAASDDMSICPRCGSDDVEVNGLLYHCRRCNDVDDSTLSMIIDSPDFRMIDEKEDREDEAE